MAKKNKGGKRPKSEKKAAKSKKAIAHKVPRRVWEAGKASLLTAGWPTHGQHVNNDLRNGLRALRSRARSSYQNNDHVAHFSRLCRVNMVGDRGIRLQAKAKRLNGKPDTTSNTAIEDAWREWGRRGVCDASGTLSWIDLQNLFVTSVSRDGEALFRRVIGFEDNEFRFALSAIDSETLDVEYSTTATNGNRIEMGVELNEWRRPVAYYLIPERQATAIHGGSYSAREHVRVPADEIYHCYLPEWVWQSRGAPWTATALLRLNMLGGYEDAEITAARVAAAKMGFYVPTEDAAEFIGDGPEEGGKDEAGDFIQDAKAGEFEVVPYGYKFEGWDPQHPNAQFGAFVKAALRGISSGLGVNYNTLANDLEGVNFTSLRHGALTDRDLWMCLQNWMIEWFCDRVYRDWLETALINGAIKARGRALPAGKLKQFQAVRWQGRRWKWVDPAKEAQGARTEYDMRKRSLSSIIREAGDDPEEVWAEIAAENELMESLGIDPPAAAAAVAPTPEPEAEPDDDKPDDETETDEEDESDA